MNLKNLNEKKIKFTFEKNVYDRLQYDQLTFNITMSHLAECVVLAYCKDSATLAKAEQENDKDSAIRKLLSNDNILFKKNLLSLLTGEGKRPRRSSLADPRTYGWTITVTAYDALQGDIRTVNEPYSFIGKLLEEFSSFTVAEKERIIMSKAIDEINEAIEKKVPFDYVSKDGNVYVMHPDRIVVDPQLQYTYVVGNSVALEDYDANTFEPNENNIKNIRFINLRYNEQGRCWISLRYDEKIKTDHQAIERRLNDVSPAFVGEPVYDVKVQLNEWGEKTYKSIIQNRPGYVSKANKFVNGFKEYTFRCTLFQAAIYFINFEDSARIIDPPEAIQKIKTRLEAVNKMYK